MNRIYKLKFSKKTNQLIAVSELANNAVAQADTKSPVNLHQISSNQSTGVSFLRSLLASSLLAVGFIGGLNTNAFANTDIVGTHGQLGSVVAGTATAVTDGLVTTIKNSPNAIINWKSFNINQDELLKFVQQSTNSAVLNRVVGGDVSKILGSLQSNGQVFVINPNGIIFGKNSHVNVGGLVASTLDINNQDFLHGRYVFNKDKDHEIAKVLNSGVIKVNADGSLALIGGQVVNNGVLEARNGTVFLLAGQSIEIADLNNPQVSYKVTAQNKAVNLGRVFGKNAVLLGNKVLNGPAGAYHSSFADVIGSTDANANQASINADGQVVLFGGSEANSLQSTSQANSQVVGTRNSGVVNNGNINVSNASGKAGNVKVLGDTVILASNSKILATGHQGGKVLIGGDATGKGTVKLAKTAYLDQHQLVDLSAQADAGHAVVWSDRTKVDGTFKATSVNGQGGFIETSGRAIRFGNHLGFNTYSINGQSGTWLIDPEFFALVGSVTDLDKIKGQKLGSTDIEFPTENLQEWTNPTLESTKKDNSKAPKYSYITQENFNSAFTSEEKVILYADKGLVLYNATFTKESNPNLNNLYLYTNNNTNKRSIDESIIVIKDSTFNNSELDVNLNRFAEGDPNGHVDVPYNTYGYNKTNGGYTFIDNSTITVNSIKHIITEGYEHDIRVSNTTIEANDILLGANYTSFEKDTISLNGKESTATLENVSNSTINAVNSISIVNSTNNVITSENNASIKNSTNSTISVKNFVSVTNSEKDTITATGKGNVELANINLTKVNADGTVLITGGNTTNSVIDAEDIDVHIIGNHSTSIFNNTTMSAKEKVLFRANSSLQASELNIKAKDVEFNGGDRSTGRINLNNSSVVATNTTTIKDSELINITHTDIVAPNGISINANNFNNNVLLKNNNFSAKQGGFELSGDNVVADNNDIGANSVNLHNTDRPVELEKGTTRSWFNVKQTIDLSKNKIKTDGDTVIHGRNGVNLTDTVIEGTKPGSNINVTARSKLNLKDGTKLTADKNVSVSAINDINASGSKETPVVITAKTGNVSITSIKTVDQTSDVTLNNVQTDAKNKTNIYASSNLNVAESALNGNTLETNADKSSDIENSKLDFKEHATINAVGANNVTNSDVISDHITANSSTSEAHFNDSNLISGCNMDVNVMKQININNSNLTSPCGQVLHSFNSNVNVKKSKLSSDNGRLDIYAKNDTNLDDSKLLSKDRLVVNSLSGHYNIVDSDLRSTEKYIDLTSNNGDNTVSGSNLITDAGCLVRFPLDLSGTDLTNNNLNKCPVNAYNPNNLRPEPVSPITPLEPAKPQPEPTAPIAPKVPSTPDVPSVPVVDVSYTIIQYNNNDNVLIDPQISYYSNKERHAVRDPARSIVPASFIGTGYSYSHSDYQGEACSVEVPKIIYQYHINVDDLYKPNLEAKYKLSARDLDLLRECYTYRPDYNHNQPLTYHDNDVHSYAKNFKVLHAYSYENRILNNH